MKIILKCNFANDRIILNICTPKKIIILNIAQLGYFKDSNMMDLKRENYQTSNCGKNPNFLFISFIFFVKNQTRLVWYFSPTSRRPNILIVKNVLSKEYSEQYNLTFDKKNVSFF